MHAFLIIKTSALGDVVHTIPVLQYLRARFPEARIDWVVEKASVDFLSAQNLVDHVIPVDTRSWRKGNAWSGMRAFYRTLRSVEYDAVFDLQGNCKSALMTLCARAKDKVGFGWRSVPEKPNLFVTNKRFEVPDGISVRARYLHIVQNYFKDEKIFHPEVLAVGGEKQKKLMVCFGSKWPNKQLSVKTWIAFLQRVRDETGLGFVFVWGDAAEKGIAEELQRAFPSMSETLGGMTLVEWQQKMDQMAAVIAVDSVGLHLCSMTSTPSFSVFGPSSAAVFKPEGERHGAFQGACPYGIGFAQRCPKLRTCPTGACLKALDEQRLFDAFVTWWQVNQNLDGSLPHRSLPSPSPRPLYTASP